MSGYTQGEARSKEDAAANRGEREGIATLSSRGKPTIQRGHPSNSAAKSKASSPRRGATTASDE
eukprot:15477039-Alexandrium_andersonii.AAC.1